MIYALSATRLFLLKHIYRENTSWKVLCTVFTHSLFLYQKSHSFDFWYVNNSGLNTVQSTFHVVLCLLYTYWEIHYFVSHLFQIFAESLNAKVCLYTPWNGKDNEVTKAYLSIKIRLVKIITRVRWYEIIQELQVTLTFYECTNKNERFWVK